MLSASLNKICSSFLFLLMLVATPTNSDIINQEISLFYKRRYQSVFSFLINHSDSKPRNATLKDIYYHGFTRKEMFYLTTLSTHFIYGYMASDIW